MTVLTDRGDPVVSIDSSLPMKPASNMKVLTTLAGLEVLGADYQFETQIVATAPLRRGKLAGDLIVYGTGDPNISGRFYDGDVLALFRTWALRLRNSGLVEVQGDLIADDSFFDSVRFLPGWKPSAMGRWFSAEISSLNLNDNCVEVQITPGTPGRKARVEVTPKSPFIEIDGAPRTVAQGKTKITIHRSPTSNRLTVRGQIHHKRKTWSDTVAVYDPALFFSYTLERVLEEEGVDIGGIVRRRDRSGAEPVHPGKLPGSQLLVDHKSSLLLDLAVINKRSQNLHAEVLLKTLGARAGGEGSVAGGGRVVRQYLKKLDADVSGLVVADGSGLAHDNRVTTEILARSLNAARDKDYFPTFKKSLPVAGVDGTLAKRFRNEPQLHGRLFAKTGYILGVSGLSGYIQRDATVWTFSMLFQRLPGGNSSVKRLQERIAAAIDRRMAQAQAQAGEGERARGREGERVERSGRR